MKIKEVAVIGGGTMGNGIAHVFALNNFKVNLVETKSEFVDRALNTIEKNLVRMVKKEKITQKELDDTMERIYPTLKIGDGVSDADLVVEAVPENFELKKKVFIEVDDVAPKRTLLASNTSSISITKIAAITSRPQKFIGMHFFNPVPVMKLVEIVRGLETDDATYKTVEEV